MQKINKKFPKNNMSSINKFEVNGTSIEIKNDSSVIDNEQFVYGIIDSNDSIVFGIKHDGDVYMPLCSKIDDMKEDILESIDTTQLDASVYIHEKNIESLNESISLMDVSINELNTKINDISVGPGEEVVNNSYLQMTVDSSGNILSYRKEDGTLKEYMIDTNLLSAEHITVSELNVDSSLNLSESAKTTIYDIFDSVVNKNIDMADYSNYISNDGDLPLSIPMPRCAKINISGISSMPTSKTANYQAFFEMWDMQGNYFKKKVILNAQGNSSLGMPKKNFAIDLFDSEWDGDAFALRIGDWVPQDSFHFKAYYADYFRCVNPVSYKLFEDVCMTRPISSNRVWKRYLLPSNDEIGYISNVWETTDDEMSLDNGARCFPDGFPCIVYLNSEFYGIFAWQIKKHRDNYNMSKKKSEHIHLDGNISTILLWNANGSISWNKWNKKEYESEDIQNKDGIEIRNPKDLIGMDGSEYDHDTNAVELIDETSDVYDSTNELHMRTAQVKQNIINASTILNKIDTAISDNKSTEDIKTVIETYFDVQSIIDYLVFSDITANGDGFKKNWQWTTHDGVKWAVNPYDLDGIFGWTSWNNVEPTIGRYGNTVGYPTYYIIKYYITELEARYKELRDCGVFTTKNILKHIREWINSVGTVYYQLDHDKWPYDKDHYSAAQTTHVDNIYRLSNWIDKRIEKCDDIYNYTK